MKTILKKIIKHILYILHIDITQNQKYDRQTLQVMRKVIKSNSNCIDVGCHKGEILDVILELSPNGNHFAFEPIPYLFEALKSKYVNLPVSISQVALSDEKGKASFNIVRNAPAYSGFRRRQYNISVPEIEEVIVLTDALDNIIPVDKKIDFIKIDVEGAEYGVLKGAVDVLRRDNPVMIFEFGMGASDYYETKPEMMYYLLAQDCELKLNTMKGWLNGLPELSFEKFCELYDNNLEYYFIAYK
jgi:FkbM family methyltransferase